MNLKCNAFMYLGGILVFHLSDFSSQHYCQATGNIQIIDVQGNNKKQYKVSQ